MEVMVNVNGNIYSMSRKRLGKLLELAVQAMKNEFAIVAVEIVKKGNLVPYVEMKKDKFKIEYNMLAQITKYKNKGMVVYYCNKQGELFISGEEE